jgi:hypothetical protein
MNKNLLFYIFICFFIVNCKEDKGIQENNETLISNYYHPTLKDVWQYQLTEDLNLSTNATIYDIDLFETSKEKINQLHQKGLKVICYFSAGSSENWRSDFNKFKSEEIGKSLDGWEGENWIDIRSNNVREIMKARLDIAKEKECDGVEADNVDGYSNDNGLNLTSKDQLEYNRFLAKEAHLRGLSIGLKNDLKQVNDLVDDFDFSINEQCFKFNECDLLKPFILKEKPVFNVEYNSKYLQQDEMVKLCNKSKQLKFNTNILPKELNGKWRYNCSDYLFQTYAVGFGGSSSFKFHDNIWLDATDLIHNDFKSYKNNITDFNESAFNALSKKISKSRYIVYWMTKEWQENWFNVNSVQTLMDEGKIPVFIYWYFGDHLVEDGYLQNNKENYLEDVKRVATFIKQFNGDKLFILEPEFNKENILTDLNLRDIFIDTINKAIDILKSEDKNIYISLAMMDTGSRTTSSDLGKCGYNFCALGDKYEWQRVDPIYNSLLNKLDFISFQQMIGQFSRDPNNPGTWNNPNPKAFSDEEIGIEYLAQRLSNFATFLKNRYNKPVFLPYITIATATWKDINNNHLIENNEINSTGWELKAKNVYKNFYAKDLFGYAVMALFDDPSHDEGGYQYFLNNEYHLGVITAPIIDKQLTGNIDFKSGIIDEIFK